MIPVKLRIFGFGIITKAIGAFFKLIYNVLSLFHLQALLFVVVLGVILEVATGKVFTGTGGVLFGLAVTFTVIYAVIRTTAGVTNAFSGLFGSKNKKNPTPNSDDEDEDDGDEPERIAPQRQEPKKRKDKEKKKAYYREKPKYYKVRQNTDYVMAEYSDRYELFKIVDGRLVYVRTDKKEQ